MYLPATGRIAGAIRLKPERTDPRAVPPPTPAPAEESGQSDLDLLRQAAAGKVGAFDALVDRHAGRLFTLARSLAESRSDAEDVCQETFIAAFKTMARFDGRASVKTWLTKILVRRAAKVWNKGKRRRQMVSIDQSRPGNGSADTAANETSLAPMLRVQSGEAGVDHRLDLATALLRLRPEHREVLVLRELDGLSYREIAAALDLPQGTVESRLHRARSELRQHLPAYEQ